ncbi:hypothetical protein LOK49_LG04G01123 [Camellia lanceoleosa]|uniref:Uncharacterized protein n=1 Tax=Camellia lanceoleosa TaxID=1840588 RepID=A0ACC0I3T2_9ERIC|nr:hypothetical protein LOK49_LG04G01123 [Camellia lanceoleosa]
MKQTNRPSKKLSGKISSSFQKNTKNQKELDPELPETKKVKRGKSLAENHFNSGNPTNAKKHSCGSSFKLIELGKEDKALESDTIKEVDKKNSSISVKHDSLGERPLQGKCMNFSPITHWTRRRSSIYLLKETEDPINSPGQSMHGAMEVGVLEKRRKNGQNADMFQVLKVGGKRCKVGLHVSEEATNIKVNQQAQKEIDVDPGDIHLKLDARELMLVDALQKTNDYFGFATSIQDPAEYWKLDDSTIKKNSNFFQPRAQGVYRSDPADSEKGSVPLLSATEEVKMTSMVDDINAYSYLYPVELPSRKFVFKWLLELLVNAPPLLIANEDKLIWEADPSGMNQIYQWFITVVERFQL